MTSSPALENLMNEHEGGSPDQIPLPNDKWGESTVVASVWTADEPVPSATLLLLNKQPPHFMVVGAHWSHTGKVWVEDDPDTEWPRKWPRKFRNIVPAVRFYEDMGGDY